MVSRMGGVVNGMGGGPESGTYSTSFCAAKLSDPVDCSGDRDLRVGEVSGPEGQLQRAGQVFPGLRRVRSLAWEPCGLLVVVGQWCLLVRESNRGGGATCLVMLSRRPDPG